MPVTIEAAGSHAFDLGHIRRQGGEELLRLLLEKAGFPLHLLWRLQVQKKLNCNGETPPVRVVDEPKKWAVHLKIKPGDNNTCHYCSLLMPNGLDGLSVYYVLGKASAELDRNWRNKNVEPGNGAQPHRFEDLFQSNPSPSHAEEKEAQNALENVVAPTPETVAPPPEAAAPAPPAMEPSPILAGDAEAADAKSGQTRGWLNDAEKTRLLLLAIHEINQEGAYSQDHWVEVLGQRMDWEGANRHEIGGVLTLLVRKALIERRMRGSKPYGYVLTEQGQRLIADLVQSTLAPPPSDAAPILATLRRDAPHSPPPPAPRTANDPAGIIRSFGPIAKQFLDANSRLEAIARREQELSAELESLRRERDRIYGLIGDNQVQNVLANLMRLVQAKG